MKVTGYNCKVCGQYGEAKYDDSDFDCDFGIEVQSWVSMLTCNRCYDFRDRRRTYAEDIWKTCYDYSIALQLKDEDKRAEAARRARESFVKKTKAFAELVCTYWDRPLIWEPDFIQLLMDEPEQCHRILNLYESGVKPMEDYGSRNIQETRC